MMPLLILLLTFTSAHATSVKTKYEIGDLVKLHQVEFADGANYSLCEGVIQGITVLYSKYGDVSSVSYWTKITCDGYPETFERKISSDMVWVVAQKNYQGLSMPRKAPPKKLNELPTIDEIIGIPPVDEPGKELKKVPYSP